MADKPITQYTHDELRRTALQATNILTEIQREQKRRRREEQQARANELKALVPSLLATVPHHNQRGCGDETPIHASAGGCVRCTLLESQKSDYWDPFYDVAITASLIRNED